MKPHNRRLQVPYNDVPFQPITTVQNSSIPSTPFKEPTTTATPAPPPRLQQDFQYSNQPFDSSMAVTVLVLLTALFFMGFFSIYIRRFSNDTEGELASHRRRPRSPPAMYDHRTSRATTSRKGLQPEVIESLPVYAYYHGDAKYQIECAICLGEFEEKETVKMIPYCEHVFHLECIDTWLKMHVTCPVCRGTQFFGVKKIEEADAAPADADASAFVVTQEGVSHGVNGRSTVENVGTMTEANVRRSSNCSGLGESVSVQRTSSL